MKKILKNKAPTKQSEVVKIHEQNPTNDRYLIGGLRNVAGLSNSFYCRKDTETMHIFFKKNKNPKLWLLTRDLKILKSNENNGWAKPSELAKFMTQDMIPG